MNGLRKCTTCKQYKYIGNFCRDRSRRDGYNYRCKACDTAIQRSRYKADPARACAAVRKSYRKHREKRVQQSSASQKAKRQAGDLVYAARRRRHNADRRARKRHAIPPWANKDAIAGIYRAAAIWNKHHPDRPVHVDHIVPLRGKTVCGLHVENNLQLLSAQANLRKQASHWPDMP